jgi:hypothetical protein
MRAVFENRPAALRRHFSSPRIDADKLDTNSLGEADNNLAGKTSTQITTPPPPTHHPTPLVAPSSQPPSRKRSTQPHLATCLYLVYRSSRVVLGPGGSPPVATKQVLRARPHPKAAPIYARSPAEAARAAHETQTSVLRILPVRSRPSGRARAEATCTVVLVSRAAAYRIMGELGWVCCRAGLGVRNGHAWHVHVCMHIIRRRRCVDNRVRESPFGQRAGWMARRGRVHTQ